MVIDVIDVKIKKFCKNCRYFKPNPGRCGLKNEFVARKEKGCSKWKPKK